MTEAWSDDVSDVLPVIGDDSLESSFLAHKGMKAMQRNFDNSGMDEEERIQTFFIYDFKFR